MVNISSKGEIARYLMSLARKGQIRECANMRLHYSARGTYKVECKKDWASWVEADNVATDITGYSAPSSYSWPECPKDCPYFEGTPYFLKSVSRDQYDDHGPIHKEVVPLAAAPRAKEAPITSMTAATRPARSEPANAEVGAAINNIRAVGPVKTFPDDKMTAKWVWENVPVRWYWIALGVLAAVFYGGIEASRLSFFKEMFGLEQMASTSAPSTAMPPLTAKSTAPTAATKK